MTKTIQKKLKKLHLIENPIKRYVAFCKRKKVVLKKVIELTAMTGVDIFMIVFDKNKQKMLEYRSDINFTSDIVASLTSKGVIE